MHKLPHRYLAQLFRLTRWPLIHHHFGRIYSLPHYRCCWSALYVTYVSCIGCGAWAWQRLDES